jgi:hypothetical protein
MQESTRRPPAIARNARRVQELSKARRRNLHLRCNPNAAKMLHAITAA